MLLTNRVGQQGTGAASADIRDWLGHDVRRVVDALGRPIALIDSFGRTTQIAYSDVGGCGAGDGPNWDRRWLNWPRRDLAK